MKKFLLSALCLAAAPMLSGCADSSTDATSAAIDTDSNVVPTEVVAPVISWTSPVVEGELAVGNPAPPLVLASIVHGEELTEFEPNKVHVVEFWATWCGPCLQGMPHISKLAQQYKDDVNFVGVTRESAEKVASFLEDPHPTGQKWAEVIQYSLALDSEDTMNQTYMKAAGQNGIPCAFIVGRDGVVDWIGHPMTMDDTLAAVVDGSFDREAAYNELAAERAAEEAQNKLMASINSAKRSKDWDGAIAIMDKQMADAPDQALFWSMQKMEILSKADRQDDLTAIQNEITESNWGNARLLNAISWGIAAEDMGTDLDLALKSALRASELNDDSDASVLDTVARVYYERGEINEAIAAQKQAVEVSGDKGAANDIAKTLATYEAEVAATKKAAAKKIEDEKAMAAAKVKAAADAKAAKEAKAAADKKAAEEKKAAADKKAADAKAAKEEAAKKEAAAKKEEAAKDEPAKDDSASDDGKKPEDSKK